MTTTQSQRERIAARWLVEQDDPDFSDEQRHELARWLMQSVENCDAYLHLVRAWRWTALLYRGEAPIVYAKRGTDFDAAPPQTSSRQAALDRRFGNLLRARRHAQGLTQTELAARAGMRLSEISRLELGTRTLTLTTTLVLARAFGISPSRFVAELETALRGKKQGKRKIPRSRRP